MLVDATTYFWALMQIDTPHKKVQYYSDGEHQTVVLPTKECREKHLGSFWTTDTPDQRDEVLEGGSKVCSDSQVTYLGCTVCFTSGARVPHDIEEIRRDTQRQMENVRLAPAAAMMMINSKVPTRWYTVASIYKPT